MFCCIMVGCLRAARSDAGRFLHHHKHMTVTQKVAYFERSIAQDRQAIRWLQSRYAPRTLQRVDELGWNRRALRWHISLLREYRSKLLPSPRAYAGACLAAIIDREDPGWNPRTWNGHGSGAYGLPQALPASKMASAGPDWASNPYTQIRWAHRYALERYGGDCPAWAHWQGAKSW